MPDLEQLTSRMLGDYRIERLLGQSQLGAAYLATEPTRGTRVMVTTFNFPEGQTNQEREQFRARFSREGAALTRLAHKTILPIYASGEQPGYVYLVTAFVKEASLGQTLKQNSRFPAAQVLYVLRQLASGLDYAHSQGVVHGMLSLANVVVNNDLEVGIAGFGLCTMLEMHAGHQDSRPLAHLSSAQGAFLGNPEYIAPERVLGLACDTRVDIYALGVMLFALLSGAQPFQAATPLDTALQRLQQPTPLLHAVSPDLPEAFDLVIGRALERDPARRFQSAGELVSAFERVVKAQASASQPSTGQFASEGQMTMPPTVNWFDEQVTPTGRWQVAPQIGSEKMRALGSSSAMSKRAASPYGTEKMDAPGVRAAGAKAAGASLAGIDPFAWWSSHANGRKPAPAAPSAPARQVSLRQTKPAAQARSQPDQPGRRKVVTLAVAGFAAAGALTIGGITFAHLTQSVKQPTQLANAPKTTAPTSTGGAATRPATKPTAAPTKAPTKAATKAPTHTGTVIGATTMAMNSAHVFSNPADGVSSLLIRLANGNFVSCERTCTHQGVAVNYDPNSKMIVCPAHGAVFDPMNAFSHVSGPGNGPLARVNIRVNGDGTVTTG